LLFGLASDTVPTPGATRSGFASQSRYDGPRELKPAIVSSDRVGVPIVLANLWLTGYLSRRAAVRTLTVWSAALTGAFMVLVVVPRAPGALWVMLFLTSLALAVCLPSCATMLSISVGEADQGRVMGNNQALQVGAESLSGILGGLLAAIMVKLSLIVLGAIAIVAAGALLLHRGRACGTG